MCQLTLLTFFDNFDLNEAEIKRDLQNFLYISMSINAQEHTDGHGISVFSKRSKKDIIIKSERPGFLGIVIKQLEAKKVSLTSPILLHVRKASVKYLNDENTVENAHPFEGANFVLAHNGTLTGAAITAEKDNTIIDSRIFHRELEKNWAKRGENNTFLEVLQETIDDFSGKMAFLIRRKDTNEMFVVRNTRADLHKADILYKGKVVGYALNTEKLPMYFINNLGVRFTDFTFDLKEEPENIEDMVLFKVDAKELKEIGKIKYWTNVTPAKNTGKVHDRNFSSRAPASGVRDTSGVDLKWIIDEFVPATKLSIPEINMLFTMTGFPLPYIKNRKDYVQAENIIKKLFSTYYRKSKRQIMEEIYQAGITLQEFHQQYAFPYFILSVKELKKIRQEILNG